MASPSLESIYSQQWTGTVAPEAEWKKNDPATIQEANDATFTGLAERCKVRIHGLDPCDPGELGHNETRWAIIGLPPTSGTGISGEKISHAVHSGDFVIGSWVRPGGDGPPVPVITTLIPTTRDLQSLPSSPGSNDACKKYTEIRTTGVPAHSRTESGEIKACAVGANAGNLGSDIKKRENSDTIEIPCPGDSNAGAMQGKVQNVIDKVNRLQNNINSLSASAIGEIQDLQQQIDTELDKAAEWMAGKLTEISKKIMEKVIKLINKASQPASLLVPLNARFAVREATNIAVEAIYCVFAKVIQALLALLKNWLASLVNTFFGVPLCVIENLLKDFIGQLLAALKGLLSSIGGLVTGLIGSVTGFINTILDFVKDLLELFNCDTKDPCPQTREWNIMEGGQASVSLVSLDINGIIDGARGVAQSFSSAFSSFDLNSFNPLNSFDLTSSLASAFSKCSGMPFVCGPPTVKFWGGGSPITHATATPIISASGGILSISVTSGGFGYTKNPFVSITSACGGPGGAVAYATIGPTGSVTGVTVTAPGAGYSPAPSGAVGTPAGPIFPAPAIVVGPAAVGALPPVAVVPAGAIGIASSGSTISLSAASSSCMTLSSGVIVCPGFSTVTTSPVSFTVPAAGRAPTGVLGPEYDVLMYLCDILIINPGFGYSPDDEVVITPSNGASAELVVGSFGEITAINIINGGRGFTDLPTITINSSTGFNAELLPKLCSLRIGEGLDIEPVDGGLPPDIDPDSVIHVVDCVGKVVAPV